MVVQRLKDKDSTLENSIGLKVRIGMKSMDSIKKQQAQLAGKTEKEMAAMQIQIDAEKAELHRVSEEAAAERTERRKVLADLKTESAKYERLDKAYKVLDVKFRAHKVSLKM